MIAGAERAALSGAALDGVIAHRAGIGAEDLPSRLGDFDIAGLAQAAAEQELRAIAHQSPEFLGIEAIFARTPHSGRHVFEQRLDERAQMRLDLAIRQARAHEPNAAIDVVADAP